MSASTVMQALCLLTGPSAGLQIESDGWTYVRIDGIVGSSLARRVPVYRDGPARATPLIGSGSFLSRSEIICSAVWSDFSYWPGPASRGSGPFFVLEGSLLVLSRLLSCLRRMATKVARAVARAIGWWRGTAWPAHLERVASNPAYAAAAAAILAGMLGLLRPGR